MRSTAEARVRAVLSHANDSTGLTAADTMSALVAQQLDHLPMPGAGATLDRWRALAVVAEFDLSLAKLYEGHTDALAIFNELRGTHPMEPGTWGVWAAEVPNVKVNIQCAGLNTVCLSGTKSWCSGAATVDHALLTAWDAAQDKPQLIALSLRQRGVLVDPSVWKAIGMAGSTSLEVRFEGAVGYRVGGVGAYLQRAGFWQGGAGVAACWWGGAKGIAQTFKNSLATQSTEMLSPFKLAALGKVTLALTETAAVLRESAAWIDAYPQADASSVALAVRLSAEQCAKRVLDEVGKAMGPTPFCRDRQFAQAAADLPVFIRQSHAEHDFLALGERANSQNLIGWTL